MIFIDLFMKRQKLVHNGGFPKSAEVPYGNQNSVNRSKHFPNHQSELTICSSFWTYLPLWTSLLVAMHDEIEIASIDKFSENK